MASYIELFGKSRDGTLRKRAATACMILADAIRADGTATAEEKQYAVRVFANPLEAGKAALGVILAANKDATLAQIDGATDAQLQTAVDAAKAILIA